jgi:uncharacterized protein
MRQELYIDCLSLLIYRDVLQDEVGGAFLELLTAETREIALPAYGAWFSGLADRQLGWRDYLIQRILTVENAFTKTGSESLTLAVKHDLRRLQRLYFCSCETIARWVGETTPVWMERSHPVSETRHQAAMLAIQNQLESLADWADVTAPLTYFYQKFGTGKFAAFSAFRWHAGEMVAIAHPDPIDLNLLVGYETQRDTILKNTEFLLAGLPALHILLYGSRGSGKSSLVKSLLQKYENLRLIEVAKSELKALPEIVEMLRDLPQKFIVFVDDLSFEEDDDAYKALKVVLEGNLTARPKNVVVYATSNRRHLVREFFEDRPRPRDADEVNRWDTVQEKLSFSDRFGLTLTFEPADQKTYLKIIHHLAQQAEIALSPEDLEFRALQWATRHNGRSGRTARQFIDFLKSELTLK